MNMILNLNLVIQFYSWFNNDSSVFTWFQSFSRVHIGFCACPSGNWITSFLWSSYWTSKYHAFESSINKLTSSHFYEIEFKEECDFDPQIYDPVQISESILTSILLPNLTNILESDLISIPVILELNSLFLESHILLWENKCGIRFQFLDLDPIPEPIWTSEPLLIKFLSRY